MAPACHENMVKVGGYILGEFGNLIAGDERSLYVFTHCVSLSTLEALLVILSTFYLPINSWKPNDEM